jgi:hypothetical protein
MPPFFMQTRFLLSILSYYYTCSYIVISQSQNRAKGVHSHETFDAVPDPIIRGLPFYFYRERAELYGLPIGKRCLTEDGR